MAVVVGLLCLPSATAADPSVAAAGPWSAPAPVAARPWGEPGCTQAGVDAAGNVMVAWEVFDGDHASALWSNRFRQGSGWGNATRVASFDLGLHELGLGMWMMGSSGPLLAVESAGNATMAWVEKSGPPANMVDPWNLMYSRYSPAAGWSPPTILRAAATDYALAALAADPAGDTWVAFVNAHSPGFDPDNAPVWFGRYQPGMGWVEFGPIPGASAISLTYATDLEFTFEPNGTMLLAWANRSGGWSNRHDVVTGWDGPQPRTTNETMPRFQETYSDSAPRLVRAAASNGRGSQVDLWVEGNASAGNWTLMARAEAAGGGSNVSSTLVPGGPSRILCPSVVLDAPGNALAVWSQAGLVNGGVWSARLEKGLGWGTPVRLAVSGGGASWVEGAILGTSGVAQALSVSSSSAFVRDNYGWSWMDPLFGFGGNLSFASSSFQPATRTAESTDLLGGSHALAAGLDGGPGYTAGPKGRGILAWGELDPNGTAIYARRLGPDNVWAAPESIGVNANFLGMDVRGAIDSRGNALLLYSAAGGLSASYAPSSGSWSEWTSIPGTENASRFIASFDSRGDALAVWHDFRQTGPDYLVSNRFVAGIGWGGPTPISSNVSHAWPDGLSFGFDDEGNGILVWFGRGGGLRASRYAPATGWGAELLLANLSLSQSEPALVVDAGGNATVVWPEGSEGAAPRLLFTRYAPARGWSPVSPVGTFAGGVRLGGAGLAVDPRGNVVAAWTMVNDTGPSTWAARFSSVGGWGSPRLLGEGGTSGVPALGTDEFGNTVIVWRSDPRDGVVTIWASFFSVPTGSTVPPAAPPEFQALAMVIAIGTIALGAVVLGTPRGGEAAAVLLLVPLFTRLRRDEIRNQRTRGRIIQFIEDNPGANFTEIRWRLNLSQGGSAYHLQVLERSGEIRRVAHGPSVRFYPASFKFDAEQLPPLTYLQRRVLEAVLELRSAPFGRIATALGEHGVTVTDKNLAYHLRVLVRKKELIHARREDGRAVYFIEDPEREHLVKRIKMESRVDELMGKVAADERREAPRGENAAGETRGDLVVKVPSEGVDGPDPSLRGKVDL